MSVNLIKTYDDMIKNSKVTQKMVDKVCDTNMYYFLRPDLKIYQRVARNSKMEVIGGLCIYPDEQCMHELLNDIQIAVERQKSLNNVKNKKGAKFIDILININKSINKYFGTCISSKMEDSIFHDCDIKKERLAKLSDFKGKNCAICIEKSLAAHIIMCVLAKDKEVEKMGIFPYKSCMYTTNCQRHIEKSPYSSGRHAVCILEPKLKNAPVYLLDSNFGRVKIKEENVEGPAPGIYELTNEESNTFLKKGGAIEPKLVYDIYMNGITQVSHRAFSQDIRDFKRINAKYTQKTLIDDDNDLTI